jgi:hypothetical protein
MNNGMPVAVLAAAVVRFSKEPEKNILLFKQSRLFRFW